MKKYFGDFVNRIANRIAGAIMSTGYLDVHLELQGRQAAWQVGRMTELNSLSDAEFRVYSQWGEDGILEWLVSRLSGIPKTFIEFGVEDYTEANTRFLLVNRNWRGLIIDGSEKNIHRCRGKSIYWRHDLTAVASFITAENINDICRDHDFSGDIGVLSIDIDGNDYWVWKSIADVKPWIVVCEYNAVFGDVRPITVPYRADFQRAKAHSSNLYFGASIRALIHLAEDKGYIFIGSNQAGNNAFFVRRDVSKDIVERVKFRDAVPSMIRESRDKAGKLIYLSGMERKKFIEELPVVDVVSGEVCLLKDMPDIYGPEWLNCLRTLRT